jgi:hypothetical protein
LPYLAYRPIIPLASTLILGIVVVHAAEGVIVAAFVGKDGFAGASETRFALLYTAGWCAVAVVLVVFDRKMWRKSARAAVPVGGKVWS